MNVALIIAGGSGQRMNQEIPKQFLNVFDKPVIVYTLEGFQRHPKIDAIEVVCLAGWGEVLRAYARQFGIDKLRWVTSGGETAQESIRNGVFALREACAADDIVVIHDGIRPMLLEMMTLQRFIFPAIRCGVCLPLRHTDIKNCFGRMKKPFQRELAFRRPHIPIH